METGQISTEEKLKPCEKERAETIELQLDIFRQTTAAWCLGSRNVMRTTMILPGPFDILHHASPGCAGGYRASGDEYVCAKQWRPSLGKPDSNYDRVSSRITRDSLCLCMLCISLDRSVC